MIQINMEMPNSCKECRFCWISGRKFLEDKTIDYYTCAIMDKDRDNPHKWDFAETETNKRQDFCILQEGTD